MKKQDPREKFVELAEKRVSNALKNIKLIGNLSNKSNYRYDQSDVRKITATLKKAIADMNARFESNGAAADERFKLD